MVHEVEVVVIGAGQAGLSSGYFLRRAGMAPWQPWPHELSDNADEVTPEPLQSTQRFVIFDHAPAAGGAWQFRWPTLTFQTVHGIYQLPGMAMPEPADAESSVAPAVSRYFAEYEDRFDLRVRRPVSVQAITEAGDGRLLVRTDDDSWLTRTVISATGTWDKPFLPRYPGQETFRGRQLHTVDYRGPAEFAGQRVVVVGAGASGIQLLLEIATVAETTWVTRRPPEFTERQFDAEWGRMVVARVEERVSQGLPPESVVRATGYPLTPQIRVALDRGILRRQPMFAAITPDGVRWDDGRFVAADVILWATGFRHSLDHLAPLRLRGPGGGIKMLGTQVAADPRIHLVGYGPSASTIGANRAGRAAVREIRKFLADHRTDVEAAPAR